MTVKFGAWVYLDDSGDPGFKFESGSSRFLVMAACIFKDPESISEVSDAIRECKPDYMSEFKYAKCKGHMRDSFFSSISTGAFSVRSIVVDKQTIYSPKLREKGSNLKGYAIRQLLAKSGSIISNAKVFVDGQDTRAFGLTDTDYFLRVVNNESPGTVKQISLIDSKANPLIQLADMTAGAVHRHVRLDKHQDSRHFKTFKHRTTPPDGSLWRFK